MTRVHAQRIMNVVDGFTTEEVSEIGVTKLVLIAGVKPGDSREKLLELARKGEPRSKIAAEVKRLTEAGKLERRHRDDDPAVAARAGKRQAPEQSEPLTIATAEQEISVPLVDKAGNHATKFADGVTGQEVTSNGVQITYTLR